MLFTPKQTKGKEGDAARENKNNEVTGRNRTSQLIAPRGVQMGPLAAVSLFRYGFEDQDAALGIVEGSNPRTHPPIEKRIPVQLGLVYPGGDPQNDVRKETIDTVYLWSVKKGSEINKMIDREGVFEKIFEAVFISVDRRMTGGQEKNYLREDRVYYDAPNIAMIMDARDYAGGDAAFSKNDDDFKGTKPMHLKETLTLEGFYEFIEKMSKLQIHNLAAIKKAHRTSEDVLLTADEEKEYLKNFEKDDDEEEETILRIATLRKLRTRVRERSCRRLAAVAGYSQAFSSSTIEEDYRSRIEVRSRQRDIKMTENMYPDQLFYLTTNF